MDGPRYAGGNVTVMVSDVDRALDFYTRGLGLQVKHRARDGWVEVAGPGVTIGLHKALHIPPGTRGAMTVGLQVQGLDEAMATLTGRGVRFRRVVKQGPLRLAFFSDPDDNPLYLVQGPGPAGEGA